MDTRTPYSKRLTLLALAVALLPAMSSGAVAATRSAAMEISFRIVESCTVNLAQTAAPSVSCAYGTPYNIDTARPASLALASLRAASAQSPAGEDSVRVLTVMF